MIGLRYRTGALCLFLLVMGAILNAQKSKIDMPEGRIAYSSDGNLHDSDDWGATAFAMAFLHYADLKERLVHYDYNNHMGKSRKAWERIMDDAAKGGAKRFGLDVSKVFNGQTEKQGAIENFVREAKKSTARDPLWFICAGPMQMPYEMLQAAPKDKRRHIYAISHSKWNNEHVHGEHTKTWADMKADFPEMTFHEIADQNTSNGEDDFHSHIQNWFWLRDSDDENWQWLYAMDDTEQVDRLENWKSDAEKGFDISDAGMTYWHITGGPNGGNEKAGWREAKALLENKPKEEGTTPEIVLTSADYIFLEAESTGSDLGEWLSIKKGDPHYIDGASGFAQLEFQGNAPDGGTPNSPLQYAFNAPKDGNYRLLIMTSKRLGGASGNRCNDVYVKLDGNYASATTLPKETLETYLNFSQEGGPETPELAWHWAQRAEKVKDEHFELMYNLKKGETYTLTVAGSSQRFSMDYMLFYNADKFSLRKAKQLFAVAKNKP
ncbi:hypothetical protein [Maribacter sp. 2307ULW6-5]|uniref:hypothetical protein n=1 Tax=Maribacter sp. 2307ULW6-5 TaxID=3386275 RepID=UPI0039BCFE8C